MDCRRRSTKQQLNSDKRLEGSSPTAVDEEDHDAQTEPVGDFAVFECENLLAHGTRRAPRASLVF